VSRKSDHEPRILVINTTEAGHMVLILWQVLWQVDNHNQLSYILP